MNNTETQIPSFFDVINLKEFKLFQDSQFWNDLYNEDKNINVNGNKMPMATYNLIIIKSQIKMYLRCGMKPTRHWKITDIKKYFNFKGNNEKFLNFLIALDNLLKNKQSVTDEG